MTLTDEEIELEGLAMNIVHQIGDALYDALPKDIAHEYFVDARQATNDVAIDFAKKLIRQHTEAAENRVLTEVKKSLEECKSMFDVGVLEGVIDMNLESHKQKGEDNK